MLFWLRKLKRDHLMSDQFRKYFLYAAGEISLVIVGILVALQIDNWNDDRQEEATLRSYLGSIAGNMRADLVELEKLKQQRADVMLSAARAEGLLFYRTSFDVDDIFFYNKALSDVQVPRYFSADLSGYEALKSSGVLDRLQGRDIEKLLSDYIDALRWVELRESDFNDFIRAVAVEYAIAQPEDVPYFAFANPSALTPEYFEALQPVYEAQVNSTLSRTLILSPGANADLMAHYDRMLVLGKVFVRLVEAGITEFDAAARAALGQIYDPETGIGDPRLVVNGRPVFRSYFLGLASSEGVGAFDLDSLKSSGDALALQWSGGAEWASFFMMPVGADEGRFSFDYSGYDRLELELRGAVGGETMFVAIKDRDDPDDEAPPSVALTLTDEWQTYEIPLASFPPVDLDILHIPLAFVFGDAPVAFSVRNARYLPAD